MAQEIEITFRVEPEQAAALLEFLRCVLRDHVKKAIVWIKWIGPQEAYGKINVKKVEFHGRRKTHPH